MPIRSAEEYIASLRGRKLRVYLFGELVEEPVDHPVIRPSVNAVAETYRLAEEEPEFATAPSSLCGKRVNRFLHVTESVQDVVQQNRMQRRLGQRTGTCFQRCVGMDAINSLYSVTYEMESQCKQPYHRRSFDDAEHVTNAQSTTPMPASAWMARGRYFRGRPNRGARERRRSATPMEWRL